MGNSLRCCLACVLPCGALDLIRIVHLNGYVEEITRPVTAGDILRANPNHKLTKPSSQGVVRRIVILSPDSELKRGGIYFLVPDSSLPNDNKFDSNNIDNARRRRQRRRRSLAKVDDDRGITTEEDQLFAGMVLVAEKKSAVQLQPQTQPQPQPSSHRRHSRRSKERLSDWKPHLDSITED